ncbi:dTDP-glucose 4,6-dehydratase [Lachnospiraceae bacterium]|nr:dTDP-glucose 4,6-dehydratase [Lachnospiraceae bacterium]
MKKVVVTGATSMIGIATIKECIKNNIEVLAVIQRQSKKKHRLPGSDLITLCECNLDELHALEIEGSSYDVFYHFAWGDTGKLTRDDPVLQEKNIQYTLDAVELARKLGCSKFIGAGSQAEYGLVNQVITAETKEEPVLSYGIAKNAAGRLSRKLCEKYGIIHIWGRIFSVYGCNDSKETMVSYAVRQFMECQPAYFSAATQMWDYLNEDDAGKIFYLLGEKISKNKVYRIASGQSRALKEFILEIREVAGKEGGCEFVADNIGENRVSLQVDVNDLMEDIHYVPAVSFKEGIQKTVKSFNDAVRGSSEV